jgi:DNA-binding NarL/FixJ family response regulator
LNGRTDATIEVLIANLKDLIGLIRPNATELQIDLRAQVQHADALNARLRRSKFSADERPTHILSKRELEVLDLIMKGLTNKEIAARLFLSFETVKCHRRHILEKTDTRNTAALVSHFHNIFRDRG